MEKFDNKISAWNFKKIARTYLIALLIAVIACAAAAGVVFKDRLSFAWQYGRVEDATESNDTAKLKTEIDKLAGEVSWTVDLSNVYAALVLTVLADAGKTVLVAAHGNSLRARR